MSITIIIIINTRVSFSGNGAIELIPEYILDIATPDMTPEAAAEWFALEDSDADGYVTRSELMRIAQQLGMTPEQADDSVSSYYMSVDTDGDDKLSFDGEMIGCLVAGLAGCCGHTSWPIPKECS